MRAVGLASATRGQRGQERSPCDRGETDKEKRYMFWHTCMNGAYRKHNMHVLRARVGLFNFFVRRVEG